MGDTNSSFKFTKGSQFAFLAIYCCKSILVKCVTNSFEKGIVKKRISVFTTNTDQNYTFSRRIA